MPLSVVSMPSIDLLKDGSWLTDLSKADPVEGQEPSRQGSPKGTQPHLIDYLAAQNLKNFNVHHSTCLEARLDAIVGLGHKSPRIDEALDPMCRVSWQDTLSDVIQDYLELGNGYLEVVRNKAGQIKGLHHLPCPHVWVFVEDIGRNFHFEITNISPLVSTSTLRFARFGDLDRFTRTMRKAPQGRPSLNGNDVTSEVIHFPRSSTRSRFYGYIDWAAGVPAMELEQCATQYGYDFFLNGGIPSAVFSVLGKQMDDKEWGKIVTEFKKHVGIGNRHKVLLLNLGDPDLTAQLDQLTVQHDEGQFKNLSDSLALKIVSAHRVPPLIAGIQVPGKLGAANEMTNAIMAFQVLAVGPAQKHISKILAKTLGDPVLNGNLGLTADDFLGVGMGDPEIDPTQPVGANGEPAMRPKNNKGNGFNAITEEIDMGQMDTMARMRTSMAEARFRGRDMSEGVAERGGEV